MLLILVCNSIWGQSKPNNYVRETIHKESTVTVGDYSNPYKVQHKVTYLDGLGRPIQTVMVQQGSKGEDIVIGMEYDNIGRMSKETVPFAVDAGQGNFVTSPTLTAGAQYNDSRGFSETNYESSPLNRVIRQAGAGQDWVSGTGDQTVRVRYLLNDGSEVLRFEAGIISDTSITDLTNSITPNGTYGAGQLSIVERVDENGTGFSGGNRVREYKDKSGRVVLKRVFTGKDSQGFLDTYYVYDDLGQLRAVIPPKLSGMFIPGGTSLSAVDKSNFNNLGYLYLYDNRGRLSKKKLPGSQVVKMVYNDQDLLSSRTDGRGIVIAYEYDGLNRLRKKKQGNTVLEQFFYDDYGSVSNAFNADYKLDAIDQANVKGMLTGKTAAILKSDGSISGEISTGIYYDVRGRVVQTVENGYGAGGTTRLTTSHKLSYTGQVLEEKVNIAPSTKPFTIYKKYTYDHADRLTSICHQILENKNGKDVEEVPHLLDSLNYNRLGQLLDRSLGRLPAKTLKKEGKIRFTEAQFYSYNIRGWWKESSANTKLPLGSYGLNATTGLNFRHNLDYTGQYNGNINSVTWLNDGGMDYSYDGVNRLTSAKGKGSTKFSEEGIEYDRNGNIKSLQRKNANGVLIDNLSYQYEGGGQEGNSNRLLSVSDNSGNDGYPTSGFSGNFSYDGNGNMTNYPARKITEIKYNLLNLQQSVTLDGLTQGYDYAADGTKLAFRQAKNGKKVYYVGPVEINDGDGGIRRIGTEEGHVMPRDGWYEGSSESKYVYYYTVKDHLGNVRLVIDDDDNANVWQKIDYHGFGMDANTGFPSGILKGPGSNDRLYNGKESDSETSWLDYGARQYDNTLGRWFVVDRFAEKYSSLSAYQYAANNPVSNIDINGDSIQVSGNGVSYNYGFTQKGGYGFYDNQGNIYSGDDKFINKYQVL
ncbi:DUF6443 domain-containing protein [Pseudarcicella hirudinis]|uniref:DUF6443 domain-containing protein n=1 Tax=Pseudarcicella hirudinis TaxID=1079859 RepID=UPI001C42FFC6|nr:DUF6443 domain-containing protein [Pseudarcicella hirudinis]